MISIEKRVLCKLMRENERYQQIIAKLAIENDALADGFGGSGGADRTAQDISRLNELLSATTNSYDALQEENACLRAQNASLYQQFAALTEQFDELTKRYMSSQQMIQYYDAQQLSAARACKVDSGALAALASVQASAKQFAEQFSRLARADASDQADIKLFSADSVDAALEAAEMLATRVDALSKKVELCAAQFSTMQMRVVAAAVQNAQRNADEEVGLQAEQMRERCAAQERANQKLKNNLQEMQRLLSEKEDCLEAMRQVFAALQTNIAQKVQQIETSGDVELDPSDEVNILKSLQKLLAGAISRK